MTARGTKTRSSGKPDRPVSVQLGDLRPSACERARCAASGRSPKDNQASQSVKGFRMPASHRQRGCTEAGVRKASREETAGEFAPALVSGYGDLAPVFDLIFDFRSGKTAERVPRAGF